MSGSVRGCQLTPPLLGGGQTSGERGEIDTRDPKLTRINLPLRPNLL
jgi:hypothetical protein